MFNFGAFPPEVISGQIYAGSGATPLLEAATAWHNLSTDLQQTAVSYRNVLFGITDVWQGPSATAMEAAVQPFLMWTESMAIMATQSAHAAMGAASAYEEVLAAVVPPPVIASNRAQLASLITSNILGQNTAVIAANEAHYAAMWAQDIAAMKVYQVNSTSAIGQLPSMQTAPQISNVSTAPVAAVASTQTTLLQFIQQIIPGFTLGDPLGNLADLLISPLGIAVVSSGEFAADPLGLVGAFLGLVGIGTATQAQETANAAVGALNIPRLPSVSVNTPPTPEVTASKGTAGRIWQMRVPPSWAQPPQSPVAESLLTTPGGGKEGIPVGLPMIPFVPVLNNNKGSEWKKGVKFEDMNYGEPVPPIVTRHPSGG
jgi:PPE-repeat protein